MADIVLHMTVLMKDFAQDHGAGRGQCVDFAPGENEILGEEV